jgi:hypothetical protein
MDKPGSVTGTGTDPVPQSILRKQNQDIPRDADAHSDPALYPMGERSGTFKRVRFSCGACPVPPQVFHRTPPVSKPQPDPDHISVSGRPSRHRRSPVRLGISVTPPSVPLGGEL